MTDETERRRSEETWYRKKLSLLRDMRNLRGLGRRPTLFLFFIFFHLQVYAVSNLFHSFDVVWFGIALYSVRLLEEALKSSLAKTEQDLRYLEGAGFWVGRVVRPNGSERCKHILMHACMDAYNLFSTFKIQQIAYYLML